MRIAAAAACISLVLLAALAVAVRVHATDGIDGRILALKSGRASVLDPTNGLLATVSSPYLLVPIVYASGRLAWRMWHSPPLAVAPAVVGVVSGWTSDHVLKPLVNRPEIGHGPASSWPSGTVAVVSGILTLVLLLLYNRFGRVHLVDALASGVALFAVMASLVLNGYHYGTDIVGGLFLGVGTAGVALLAVASVDGTDPLELIHLRAFSDARDGRKGKTEPM